jgi:hypothetical protein
MTIPRPVAFPPEALLVLEERLKERQREDGWPPPDADLTEVALVLLVGDEIVTPGAK